MTKKDYELIASVFQRISWDIDNMPAKNQMLYRDAHKAIAQEMSAQLEKQNTRFNEEKFLKGCDIK